MGHSIGQYSALLSEDRAERCAVGLRLGGHDRRAADTGSPSTTRRARSKPSTSGIQARASNCWCCSATSIRSDLSDLEARRGVPAAVQPLGGSSVPHVLLLRRLGQSGQGGRDQQTGVYARCRASYAATRRRSRCTSRCTSIRRDGRRTIPTRRLDRELVDGATALTYYRGSVSASSPFSRLNGKRLFAPPPIEASGFPPFERSKHYEEFLIGHSATGAEVRFTSDPGAPRQLLRRSTRAALTTSRQSTSDARFCSKYYADPRSHTRSRTGICDVLAYGRCASTTIKLATSWCSWVTSDATSRRRRRAIGVASTSRLRRKAERDAGCDGLFGGQFADPKSLDLRLPTAYRKTNDVWTSAFSWPLFQPARMTTIAIVLSKLHVPVTDGRGGVRRAGALPGKAPRGLAQRGRNRGCG